MSTKGRGVALRSRLLPRLSLFRGADAARSISAPNSPRPETAAVARTPRGCRQRNASAACCSMEEPPARHPQLHPQQSQQPQPPPPPYPRPPGDIEASRSLRDPLPAASFAATNGEAAAAGIFLPAAAPGFAFQEVREISLGRHHDQPFGLKIENVGEAFFITHVVRNSVADCAGLKVGDEVVRINDRRLEGLKTKEVLQIVRQSEICVKVAFKPRAVVARIREVRLTKSNGVLGLRLQRKPDGLYIDFVKAESVAQGAGLKDGDQVLKINGHVVTDWSMEGAMALLKSLSDLEPLALLIRETLPLAHVSPGDAGGAQQQQMLQFHRRQCSSASSAAAPRNGDVHGLRCSTSERTASCSRLGEVADSRRPLGRNPCTSTDDLEITRLPLEPGAEIGSPASASSASFIKSSRLTSFFKSARISRHQQRQSAVAANSTERSS